MSSSPTPSEQERADAAQREKEAAEQAALPYRWTQTIGDVDVSVPVPGHLRGHDIDVVLKKRALRVGVKGQPPIIDVSFIFFYIFFIFCFLLFPFSFSFIFF